MLLKELPFLRICVPLCSGIIAGLFFSLTGTILLVSACITAALFTLSLLHNRKEENILYGLALTAALFLAGNILFVTERTRISNLRPEQARFECILSDYPAEKPGSYLLKLKLIGLQDGKTTQSLKGSVLLYHQKESLPSGLQPGDRLLVDMKPRPVTSRGNPCEFNYVFYMENQGIRYFARPDGRCILKISSPPHRSLIARALITRERIIRMYEERGITGERLALVAAITLGQKNMLDPGQKEYFIRAGVMHIMAVSGLHTVILSLFILNLLFFLKGRFNILRIAIALLVIWAFAFVTGLTPSVLRATLMFTFLQAGNLMKRPVNGINSVLASAFVLLMLKPSVIFDAGFLLSYSAVIYIIAFYHDLHSLLTVSNRAADWIWQSAALTLTAQAGTLPLTITLFNRFPVYFILTNIIIVPLSSLLVITGCILPLVYPLRFLSVPAASVLNFLTGLTEKLTREAASLPAASIESIGMNTTMCVLLTAALFLAFAFLLKKRPFSPLYPLFFMLVFVLAGLFRDLAGNRRNELIVYYTPGHSTIGIRTGRRLDLYSDTSATQEVKRHCAVMNLDLNSHSLGESPVMITAGKTRILIAPVLGREACAAANPDFVILTGRHPGIKLRSTVQLPPRAVLIAADGLPALEARGDEARRFNRLLFPVRRSGAYVRRI